MRKLLLFALSLVGLFDSLYLWWVYTSPTHPMVCLGTGCDVVRASSYANFAGHPLPSYGAAMYAALAVLILAEVLVSGDGGSSGSWFSLFAVSDSHRSSRPPRLVRLVCGLSPDRHFDFESGHSGAC